MGKNLFDLFMFIMTGGLWLVWMLIRYLNADDRKK